MDATSFRAPLRLRMSGRDVQIETLQEAAAFLRQWPQARRGPVFMCAVRACEAAQLGSIKVEDCRRSFESFARITGILVKGRPVMSIADRVPPIAVNH